ncbi:MAG: BACON domain-containing protein [Bacteroidales bacterium]|nr:BACON domain-containing protein [Candidatus Cacconaster merdequi]
MKRLLTITAVFVLALCLSSCEKYVLPELNLEADAILFAPGMTVSADVKVFSNVKWEVAYKTQSDAVTFSPDSGEGDGLITISVTASPDTVTLYVRSETIRKELTILHPAVEDISY